MPPRALELKTCNVDQELFQELRHLSRPERFEQFLGACGAMPERRYRAGSEPYSSKRNTLRAAAERAQPRQRLIR